jgi:hypothetical protein
LVEETLSQIEFELDQIDRLLESYADLLERALKTSLDLVEITAIASVLHSFYNGLERILLSIAKGIDQQVPEGSFWHRDLLQQMSKATPSRPAVLTAETSQRLVAYMGFRHFYRHSYSFDLEWDELEKLVTPLADTWNQVKRDLRQLVIDLRARSD